MGVEGYADPRVGERARKFRGTGQVPLEQAMLGPKFKGELGPGKPVRIRRGAATVSGERPGSQVTVHSFG